MKSIRSAALMVALLLSVVPLSAGTMSSGCLMAPVMQPDSQPVCANAPGLGAPVNLPDNGDFYKRIWAEDLNALLNGLNLQGLAGDGDFNDAVFDVFGIVGSDIFMQWFGATSAYTNSAVYIAGLPVLSAAMPGPVLIPGSSAFAGGSELIFQIRVEQDPTRVWNTGPAFRNADNTPHAIVQNICPRPPVEPVPEPAAVTMLGFGLVGLAWFRRRKSL